MLWCAGLDHGALKNSPTSFLMQLLHIIYIDDYNNNGSNENVPIQGIVT